MMSLSFSVGLQDSQANKYWAGTEGSYLVREKFKEWIYAIMQHL